MKKEIDIKKKKPRLAYDGMDKKTLLEAVPTQVIEVVYPSKAEKKDENTLFAKGELQQKITKSEDLPKNRLIWTNDNLVALKTLLDEKDPVSGEYKYRNKIDLIYIDPPFMVQDDFVAQNTIDIEVDKEEDIVSVKEPTIIETIAYKDTWQNGLDSFLQMMSERLLLMKELLAPTGSIYVHLDWHTSHYVKVLMDEIFDYSLFKNEIVWHYYNKYSAAKKAIPRAHDVILFYSKTETNFLEEIREMRDEPVKQLVRENVNGVLKNKRDEEGNLLYREAVDKKVDDVWRIPALQYASKEWTGFPTQKHPDLLNRIISASCPRGGVIMDAFVGSGTTAVEAEKLFSNLNCTWIGIDNSKFAIHTARKRLIELNGKRKGKSGEGIYKVRPFTVENMGYYQRGIKWGAIQISKQADIYRQAIIELFGGEFSPYSKLLHGKKRGTWIHVGPLSQPLISNQVLAIAEEVKETEFKKCYILSADFTAHLNKAVEEAKEKFGVQIITRIIPASAIEEVKKRLELIKQGVKHPEKVSEMPNLAFFAPLTIKINKVVDGKEVMIELAGVEVDAESFLDSQKLERREELKKWLEKEKSWQSFVDFWAIDWDYENLKDELKEEIFENEWQSFRKRKGKKIVEDLVFKAFNTYKKAGEYTIAVKVTDVFGNDGIVEAKIVIKK
ncbi:MAG: site-specific DNA-methyltransferase [Parcubacteria group bacterium]|nr:site-specific DNA-methyltransferase [Parcubacteria group bacterium]